MAKKNKKKKSKKVEVEAVENEALENLESNTEEEAEAESDEEIVQKAIEGGIEDLNSDIEEIEKVIEALVFASPESLSFRRLKKILETEKFATENLKDVLESMIQRYENSGFRLVKVNQSYQFRTNPNQAQYVQRLSEEKPTRLSKSALEVLAVIAYKQPVTRADLDNVRGIDSGHLMKGLLEKNLVRTMGHKEAAGRPLLYGTTPYFLEVFELDTLDDLPSIEEFQRELDSEGDMDGEAEVNVYAADPDFFDRESPLAANPDRGDFDDRSDEELYLPDFSSADEDEKELASDDESSLESSAP